MKTITKRFIQIFALAVVALLALGVFKQTYAAGTNADANSQSASDAGAMAQTGAITFEASDPRRHTSVSTTPSVYIAPSMFGGSNNCGQSSTAGVSVTGFGIGGSMASESAACNDREDTATAWNLGLQDVARLRFFCFGQDANRKAYEAAGNRCPDGATAQGLSASVMLSERTRMATASEMQAMYSN